MIEYCLASFKVVVLPKEDERTYSAPGEFVGLIMASALWRVAVHILPKEDM